MPKGIDMVRTLRTALLGCGLAICTIVARPARAQDAQTLDQARKDYRDALAQLKAAQDRKNELASENAKLNTRVAELEKELENTRHEATADAENTYSLRLQMATWDTFLRANPDVSARWRTWLNLATESSALWPLTDGYWPWNAE